MYDQGQASGGRSAMDTRLLLLTPGKTSTRAPPQPPSEKARCWEALYFPRVRFPRKDLLPASHLARGRESPVLGFWKILAPAVKKMQYFTSGMVSYI